MKNRIALAILVLLSGSRLSSAAPLLSEYSGTWDQSTFDNTALLGGGTFVLNVDRVEVAGPDSFNVEGSFDWSCTFGVFGACSGRELVSGSLDGDELTLAGFELVNPVNLALSSYRASVSDDRQTINGVFPDIAQPFGTWNVEGTADAVPTPVVLLNPNANLDAWGTTGNGSTQVTQDQAGDAVVRIAVADESAVNSPVIFSTLIDTPEDPFFLDFDYFFETATGSLEVSLSNVLLDTLEPTESPDFISYNREVTQSSLLGLTDAELSFSLFPGSPASVLLGDVSLNFQDSASVPVTSTVVLLLAGMLGLRLRRNS
jgi:hypothetical protein